MKWIAHRGNLEGPSERENHPAYLREALGLGFDVEADVWVKDGLCYLGHDYPQYEASLEFLLQENVWCHAKNIAALQHLQGTNAHCFWHQDDDFTLTSEGKIWTFPGKKLVPGAVCVMPELATVEYTTKELEQCHAICTDYVASYVSKWKDQAAIVV